MKTGLKNQRLNIPADWDMCIVIIASKYVLFIWYVVYLSLYISKETQTSLVREGRRVRTHYEASRNYSKATGDNQITI